MTVSFDEALEKINSLREHLGNANGDIEITNIGIVLHIHLRLVAKELKKPEVVEALGLKLDYLPDIPWKPLPE